MVASSYTEQEVTDAVACLEKWQANRDDYPFVIAAVPVLLWAYQQLKPKVE